jgi:hypothetical protein
MSSRNPSRKYDSGYQKRKKKQRIENLIESQKASMDKFVIKDSQVSSDNQPLDQDPPLCIDNGSSHVDDQPEIENNIVVEGVSTDNIGSTLNNLPIADVDANNSFQPDIFDPKYWDSLDTRQIDILAVKGPRRDLSIQKGPKDKYSRRFSAIFYNRVLSNGDLCDRDWLVYSKELDRVFCFGCKLFTKGQRKGQLANEGYNDWIHLGSRLKEHETSASYFEYDHLV